MRRWRVAGDGPEAIEKIRAPGIPGLVQAGVGQHIVEKNRLGNILAPRHFTAGTIGESDVFQQEVGVQGFRIVRRHVGEQELHALALIDRAFFQGTADLRGVFTRAVDGFFQGITGRGFFGIKHGTTQ